MNTSTVFRIATAIMGLNGIMALFATDNFFSMAGMDVTADMVTLGQFMGVTFLFFALVAWKASSLTGETLAGMGRTFAIGETMWAAIIAYHVFAGMAEGMTAYANLGVAVLMAVLFFVASRK
ncbi:MAG: hypothetical protein P8K81_00370 [Flavobacteriales bacterium]|nr:hypothetical protein [Flavobacteriales bacterium]